MTAVRIAATARGSVFRSRCNVDPERTQTRALAALEGARGYTVADNNGRVGVAHDIRTNRSGQLSPLAIRSGSTGPLVLLLPIERVCEIDAAGRTIRIDEDRVSDYEPTLTDDGDVVLRSPRWSAS
jgi:hypothetical protein